MVPPFLKRIVLTPPTGLASLTSTVAAVTVFFSPLELVPVTAITIAPTATTAARPSSTVRCLRDMRSPFAFEIGLPGRCGQPTGGGPRPAPATASAGRRRTAGAGAGCHEGGS